MTQCIKTYKDAYESDAMPIGGKRWWDREVGVVIISLMEIRGMGFYEEVVVGGGSVEDSRSATGGKSCGVWEVIRLQSWTQDYAITIG